MPKRKDEPEDTEKIIIRWTKGLRERCDNARKAGAHSTCAESTFIRYLIELGVAKYERSILPQEITDNEPSVSPEQSFIDYSSSSERRALNQFVQSLTKDECKTVLEAGKDAIGGLKEKTG